MMIYDDLMDDICRKLSEDYDVEPCTDDSKIDLQEITTEVQNILNNNDMPDPYNVFYYNTIHTVIEQCLEKIM